MRLGISVKVTSLVPLFLKGKKDEREEGKKEISEADLTKCNIVPMGTIIIANTY